MAGISLENLAFLGGGFFLGTLVSFILARTGMLFFSQRLEQLSQKALNAQGRSFMDMAQNHFTGYLAQARREFDLKGEQICRTMDPVKQSLSQYEERLRAMEADRRQAHGSITEALKQMGRTQYLLQTETGNLVKALRVPHVRGRWGETTLKRAVELAGMVNHCDFFEQSVAPKEGRGSLRPDMLVTLPGNRNIIVDAKVPLMAYLDALDAKDENEQKECMANHARQVAAHIRNLSSKQYTRAFSPTPEFVVLFVPGENFFAAALAQNPNLIEEGIEKGVVLATPTTLIALLKTVSFAWQQQKSHENAQEIRELGALLYQRLSTMGDHFNRLGRDIEKCAASYNKTLGTLEKRAMVPARKLSELGVSAKKMPELSPLEPGQYHVRSLAKEEANHEIA